MNDADDQMLKLFNVYHVDFCFDGMAFHVLAISLYSFSFVNKHQQ